MNFSEKTAVVTGGSRGLGRAICLELARGGANVMLCYAGNEAAANETAAACESLGAKAVAIRCDVSKEDEVKALMDAALKTFGRIDILVNNAGITRDGLLMMMKPEDFDAVIAANLLRGKLKPDFTPNVDCGDYVIIVNVEKAVLTGRKLEEKYYRRHSGWIGGLKETKYKTLMAERPEFAMELAVKGMLPKNTIGRTAMTRLKLFKGPEHIHAAQKPEAWTQD